MRVYQLCLLVFFCVALICQPINADVPPIISFQGRLTDETGMPLPDSNHEMTFRLYESASGGSAMWTEEQSVSTINGLFVVMLGDAVPFSVAVDFHEPLWLSVEIESGGELSPRYQLGASPYAFRAIFSDTAIVAQLATFALETDFSHFSALAETSVFSLSAEWGGIVNIPPGFADGIDNEGTGISYIPGDGIDITGDVISISDYGVSTAKLANSAVTPAKIDPTGGTDGQILKIVGGVVQWTNDETAGTGTGLTQVYHSIEFVGTGEITNPLELADGGISAQKLSDMGASANQVLKWNGSAWMPANDETGGTTTLALDDLTDVNAPSPADGQVVKWNAVAGEWQASNDIGGGTGDNWGTQVVQSDATLDGDGTSGNELTMAQQGATTGQVLKWTGTSWEPANDIGGGIGDDWGSQVAQTNATLNGDGTPANALGIAQQGATLNQVLKWNGSSWSPANDSIGTGGTGGVGGSGTDNYIPRWNGTSDIENSSIYQADGGNIGIGTTAPNARLEIENAPGTGMIIGNTGIDGMYIDSTYDDGIHIFDAGMDGIHIQNTFAEGIDIRNPGAQGIQVFNAGGYAMYIVQPAYTGLLIQNPGHHGIEVDSCAWAGLYINHPFANGIEIAAGSTTPCGISISSFYGTGYPDTGIVIRNVGHDGIYVASPGNNGVYVDSPSTNGMYVGYPGGDGVDIDSPGNYGVDISYPGLDGVYISSPVYDGLSVDSPGDDGVDVRYPTGDCYICDGTPHRIFRVSNKAEIYGHAYNQYIVDESGIGIAAPISVSTARWLEHLGEARLSDGHSKIELPQEFLTHTIIDDANPMMVFVTPSAPMGEYWVERGRTFFIVHQTSPENLNAQFMYRVCAKVRGSEDDGIEQIDISRQIENKHRKE